MYVLIFFLSKVINTHRMNNLIQSNNDNLLLFSLFLTLKNIIEKLMIAKKWFQERTHFILT